LTVASDFSLKGMRIGDSLSVNGVCLTAVHIQEKQFGADVSPETLSRSTFGRARIGERVNLERALRLSDRLDGHLVTGHVDGCGRILERSRMANAIVVDVGVAPSLARHMIEKGSVAVDGISLTLNRVETDRFQVSIIPHTAKLSTIGFKPEGAEVHIETDVIGKYVERLMRRKTGAASGAHDGGIDMDFLARSGFLR
jgi:riboflavin synthase